MGEVVRARLGERIKEEAVAVLPAMGLAVSCRRITRPFGRSTCGRLGETRASNVHRGVGTEESTEGNAI